VKNFTNYFFSDRRKQGEKNMGIEKFGLLTVLGILITLSTVCGGELIEPTRALGGPEKARGGLTVFSEPPQLDVYLDGEKRGSTPLWLRQVEATRHTLKIDDRATDVQIMEGKTTRIGLFKGEWVTFSEVAEKTVVPKTPGKEAPQRPPMQQPQEEQKKEELSHWERFVNGSLKHF
jgi:hypothetical protein